MYAKEGVMTYLNRTQVEPDIEYKLLAWRDERWDAAFMTPISHRQRRRRSDWVAYRVRAPILR